MACFNQLVIVKESKAITCHDITSILARTATDPKVIRCWYEC